MTAQPARSRGKAMILALCGIAMLATTACAATASAAPMTRVFRSASR